MGSPMISELDKKRLLNVYRTGAAEIVGMPSLGLREYSLRGLIEPYQERSEEIGGQLVAVRDFRITRLGYQCLRSQSHDS